MKDLLTAVLVGGIIYLLIKESDKSNKKSANGLDSDLKQVLPPLPKEKSVEEASFSTPPQQMPYSTSPYDKFGLNVVDPRFGQEFFQYGISLD